MSELFEDAPQPPDEIAVATKRLCELIDKWKTDNPHHVGSFLFEYSEETSRLLLICSIPGLSRDLFELAREIGEGFREGGKTTFPAMREPEKVN